MRGGHVASAADREGLRKPCERKDATGVVSKEAERGSFRQAAQVRESLDRSGHGRGVTHAIATAGERRVRLCQKPLGREALNQGDA